MAFPKPVAHAILLAFDALCLGAAAYGCLALWRFSDALARGPGRLGYDESNAWFLVGIIVPALHLLTLFEPALRRRGLLRRTGALAVLAAVATFALPIAINGLFERSLLDRGYAECPDLRQVGTFTTRTTWRRDPADCPA